MREPRRRAPAHKCEGSLARWQLLKMRSLKHDNCFTVRLWNSVERRPGKLPPALAGAAAAPEACRQHDEGAWLCVCV